MSQQGYLVWYTESKKMDATHVLKHLPELVGFERADFVYRTAKEVAGPDEDDDAMLLAEEVLASELHRLFVAGTSLKVDAEMADLGTRIKGGIVKRIPKSVRGDFMPNRPFFRVGKHYLYDSAETEKVFAHPTVVVGCWGYSSPKNWKKMRELVFQLPEVRQETLVFEHLLGELKQAIFWYV